MIMMDEHEHTSRSSLAFANSTTLQQYGGDPNVLFNVTIHPDEDWTILTDPVERRRVQNRIAQRGYRNRLKQSKKQQAAAQRAPQSGRSSPSPSAHGAPAPKDRKQKDYYPPTSHGGSHGSGNARRQNRQYNHSAPHTSEPVSTHHHYVRKSSSESSSWVPSRETVQQNGPIYATHQQQYHQFMASPPPLAMEDIHIHDASMSPYSDAPKKPIYIDPSLVPNPISRIDSFGTSYDSHPTSASTPSQSPPSHPSPPTPPHTTPHLKDLKHIDGSTALHRAAFYGHSSVVHTLLSGGADPHALNHRGLSTLHLCSLRGHEGLVKLLLGLGADPNARTRGGKTALHLACKRDHVSVVRVLLSSTPSSPTSNPSSLSQKNQGGKTKPGHSHSSSRSSVASAGSSASPLRKADPNALTPSGRTPLHVAAERGYGAVVRALIEGGADVDMRDREGLTALHLASVVGREGMVKLLIEGGADVHAKSDKG